MKTQTKKIFAKIALASLLSNIFSGVFAGEIPYTFDTTNQANIFAFSGVTTPNYLNGANLDLSKSSTGILSWRGNGNGWGIDTDEKGNDKLEVNSNEAIGFNLGTGTTLASFRIKHDKDNTHAYENFQFKAFDASYAPVTISTTLDSHDQAKTKVILKSSSNFKYVVMIGSDDGLNILEESDITTGCSGGSTVTSVTKYGYTTTGSLISSGLLNIAGGNSSIFAGSNNSPKDWGVQTSSSDKMYVNANEEAVFDFGSSSVKANVYINAAQGLSTQINVRVFDSNRVEIPGASGVITASSSPTAGSYKVAITAPQSFRYVALNPTSDTNKFTIYDLIDIFDYSCGKMATDFRLQNQNGPLNEPNDIVKYFIQIGNPGNVDLTGIDVQVPIPTDYTNLSNITIPSGAVNHSNATTLSVSGISIPVGGSGTITYTVKVGAEVANGTTIPTNITVGNSAEGVAGGTGTLDFLVGTPNLGSSVSSSDLNGGSLSAGDIVEHTVTVTNTGTAIGNNLSFNVDYNSGTTFVTGACAGLGNGIIFATGSLDGTIRGSSIKTKSISTNDNTGIMTFTINDLPVGVPEIFHFCSKVKPGTSGDVTPKIHIDMDGGYTQIADIPVTLSVYQNTAPVAQNDIVNTDEDTPVQISVLENDSDINEDMLSITSLSGVTSGTAQINNGNTGVIFTPTLNFNGTGSFSYTITDGNGGSATAQASINILPVNDAPIATDDTVGTQMDTQKTIDVLSNDSDIENDPLSLVGVQPPLHGTASISENTIIYTPDEGYTGNDTFEYEITDGNLNDTGTVYIVVSNGNTTPIATSDSTGTTKNTPKTIGVLSNDSDPENDILTIVGVTSGDYGTTTISGNTLVYTPNHGYSGNDQFTYTISDGYLTDTATVDIFIENRAPEATDDATGMLINHSVTLLALNNDSDADGDTISLVGVETPLHGTASLSGNTIIYTPNENYTGDDTFEYSISDGELTDTGSVSINISPIPTINIGIISGDDVINNTEHSGAVMITGSTSNVEDGNIVSLTLNAKTYIGVVNNSGFSIEVNAPDIGDLENESTYSVGASTKNNAQFEATSSKDIEIKLTIPKPTILSPLSGDVMISDIISGTGKYVGDSISVTGTTSSGTTFHCNSIVSQTGSWNCRLEVGLSHDGETISIQAQETDIYGNTGNDTSSGITIKLTPPPINNEDFTPETQIKLGTGNTIHLLSTCIGSGTYIDVYNENLTTNPTTYACTGTGDVNISLPMHDGIEGSTQEFNVKRRDNFGNQVSGDTKSVGIDDNDGIDKSIEDAGPNNGDANNDGIKDSTQTNATSVINPITSTYNALYSSGSDCRYVQKFSNVNQNSLEVKDTGRDYPLGLWDINIECIHTGATADVSIYLDKVYNTAGWTYKKYNQTTKVYTDISNIITYTTANVGTGQVTVVNYKITDGGVLDDDGVANRFIKDPAGPTMLTTPTTTRTSSSGGGGGGGASVAKDICPTGDYSGSYYDGVCGKKPTNPTPEKETKNTTPSAVITPPTTPKKEDDTSILDEIQNIYKDYQNKKKRLDEIQNEENASGTNHLEKLPKTLPKTGTDISLRTKTLKNDALNLSVSKESLKLAGSYVDDVNYWKDALPEIDKNASEILVTPSNGMVIPVVSVPSFEKDYSSLISGKEIEVNKYLKNGALKYPGTGDNGYGEIGNTVVFGHSSYFKKDTGRYKTLFQEIISLDAGEPIWIYKKLENGSYERFVYLVEKSYETTPSDVNILNAGTGKNLTLFTCTPIGNLTGRWVVSAKYFDEEKEALQNELSGKNISQKHKNIFNAFIKKFSSLPKDKQAKIIVGVFQMLESENAKKIFGTDDIAYFKQLLVQNFIGE